MIGSREKKRFDALREMGCIACKHDHHWSVPEVHHLVDKGYRKHSGGHQATIPLCPYHHRGALIENHSLDWMRRTLGPSMALESKAFAERYGSQRQLLAEVNEMLAVKA